MEILFGVAGLIAAVFVVVFGGRGIVDMARGISERRRAKQAAAGNGAPGTDEGAQPVEAAGPPTATYDPPPEPDPIYRRTFVGRDAELDTLHKAFDEAVAGRGSIRRDQATLCDLNLDLGEAYLPIDPGRALEHVAPEAFRLAEAIEDGERASHACRIAFESGVQYRGYGYAGSGGYSEWAERADVHARAGTVDRVNADTFMGFNLLGRRDIPAAHARLIRAIELAFDLDDGDTLFHSASAALQFLQAPKYRAVRAQWAARLATRSRAGVRSDRLAPYLMLSAFLTLDTGDRPAAARIWGELRDLGERTGDTYSVLFGPRRDR